MSPKRRVELQMCRGFGARRQNRGPMDARYFDLIREMKSACNHCLRLGEPVRQRGIKPTARLFRAGPLTVRKWWRRCRQHGPSGLRERSRAPHHSPRKTPPEIERPVLALLRPRFDKRWGRLR